MSLFVNRILGVALSAVFMAGAAATSASAQQAQFRLPFPAKWGGIILPPGDYRISLPPIASERSAFVVRGPAGISLILPMNSDPHGARSAPPAEDYLQLVKVNGEYFVKKYEASSRALTFFFKAPQPNHRSQLSAEDFANIPVSGN